VTADDSVPHDQAAAHFMAAWRSSFTSALRWHHLDALWERIGERADAGCFLYAVGEAPPTVPATAERVRTFIRELDALLRAEHREDYCGIVYADDLTIPTLVKVYDPHHLGVSCGSSTNPPLPGWVLSLLRPVDLPATRAPDGRRRRWWQRLWVAGG
jgi:hypothetical protein